MNHAPGSGRTRERARARFMQVPRVGAMLLIIPLDARPAERIIRIHKTLYVLRALDRRLIN